MSKEKNTDTQVARIDDLSGHFDRHVLHRAMKMAEGSQAEAHRILVEAGCPHTRKWLNDQIHDDHVLKAYWIDGAGTYSKHEFPADLTPEQERTLQADIIKREEAFIRNNAVDQVFGEHTKEVIAFADFAQNAFSTTINIVHGVTVTNAINLHKRAEHIVESILLNDEEVEHIGTNRDGEIETYRGPKYTAADKLEWQKEWTSIMDTLRKFSDSANTAALARIKAQSMDDKDKGKGKSGRGKRAFI